MEPYKIYDFEDEKAWLKGRLNGIGGSDASAVVGKNPYKTNIELFEEKTGRRIAPDISEKPYVIYGKEAEQYIRELFRLDYPQYQVMHHEYRILQSLDYPWMGSWLIRMVGKGFWKLRPPTFCSLCSMRNGRTGSRITIISRCCIICW